MNRFRTKKKAKDTADVTLKGDPEHEGGVIPSIPSFKPSKAFRLGKKQQEPPPKVLLDVANALPSSDEFRTSLLMSGLSARFSMLREQDDPRSKIGKASDDSVLFQPKRQSRLHEFGFSPMGLSDIAEVSSINGSIRPSFVVDRKNSYNTLNGSGHGMIDDPSHTGSIMDRARPVEPNNEFIPPPKMKKVPVKSLGVAKALGGGESGMGSQGLHESESNQSSYHRLREREESENQFSRSGSPPLIGYNGNRETSSTTSSAGQSNTRMSTAATSVTSQRTQSFTGAHTPLSYTANNLGVDRSTAKSRRLYETGLDQHLHEQQHSAMHRIDTLTRQRNMGAQTPPSGHNSPIGAAQPGENWDRTQILGKASMPNLRATSPPPTATHLAAFDFGVKNNNAEDLKSYGVASPPLSPPTSDYDELTTLPVQPNDRGKATALGTFHKPAQPYDETKYSQRQLQLQQGRDTPPLRNHSPPRPFVPRQKSLGRMRADSSATYASGRSSSNSSAQRQFFPSGRIPESPSNNASSSTHNTFLEPLITSHPADRNFPKTLDEERQRRPEVNERSPAFSNRLHFDQPPSLERPPESQHPANRQRPLQTDSFNRGTDMRCSPGPSNDFPFQKVAASSVEPTADSPTLGPVTGLSGMVRQHLRSDSNASSIYAAAPSSAGYALNTSRDPIESQSRNDYITHDNPWQSGDWTQSYYGGKYDSQAGSEVFQVHEPTRTTFPDRSPDLQIRDEENSKPSWEKEVEAHHTREGSSTTQKEREDFRNELAARRKRVQQNLKSFVETENKAVSPSSRADWLTESNPVLQKSNALGLLKTKTSRGSLVNRSKDAGPLKTMKMLGIGAATITSGPSPNETTFGDKPWTAEGAGDEQSEMGGNKSTPFRELPPPTKSFAQARRDARRDRERQIAMRHQKTMAGAVNGFDGSNDDSNHGQQGTQIRDNFTTHTEPRQRLPSRDRHPPPVTMNHRSRNGERDSKDSTGTDHSGSRPPSRSSKDGSSSDASGRSKSRNGRYRDDLAKAMAEGTSSSTKAAMLDEPDMSSARYPPRSPLSPAVVMSSSATSPLIGTSNGARSRSNSRTRPALPFDIQIPFPVLQNGEPIEIGLSPRPSPFVPSFTNTNATPSPNPSGANTPTANGFNTQTRVPAIRKRSVNKSEISEPTFVSSTSRITTIDLPEGASLQNGSETYAPPIPPVNPRRRQPRAVFGALMGKKADGEEVHTLPAAAYSTEEMSNFSADEGESKSKAMRRLRKSSSEGGNLNVRARQAAMGAPSPAVPDFPPHTGNPTKIEGGMF